MIKRRLSNINQLSEYTDLAKNTIYSWVNREGTPFVKCGKLTEFDLQRINEWIKESSGGEKRRMLNST